MNGRIFGRRLACLLAFTWFSGAGGWGQTIPRDPQVVSPAPVQPPRDRPPTPATGTGVVKGHVVDGVTGRPIVRARLRLNGPGGTRGPVLTDGVGAFTFDRLAPGAYQLMAEKSTYISQSHPDTQRSVRARYQRLAIVDAQVIDDITIHLFHSAAIAGRVVDAHGDPIEGAMVAVMTPPRGGRPQMRNSTQTNDLGEFRISRLTAGKYFLIVRAQQTFFGGDAANVDPPIAQPVPTYYPGTPSLDDARPLVLNRGETISGIDITLGEGLPTIVNGLVVPTDGQPLNGGNVMARSTTIEGFGGVESSTGVRPDGTFRLQLTPGEYTLEARSFPRTSPGEQPRPENEQVGTARITVTGSGSESVSILLGRGATATGRVVFEGTTPPPVPPAQFNLPLYNPSGPGCRPARATIAPDWTFKVDGLSGTCGLPPGGSFGRWTVKAVNVRGQNLMDRMLTFETGQAFNDVTIVVTDKRTQVDIGVTDEAGQPTHEFAALLFPADKERWSQLQRYVRTVSATPPRVLEAQRGSMVMPAGRGMVIAPNTKPNVARVPPVPPGDYYAIAFEDLDPEDTLEPTVLDKLIPSATRITITDEAPLEIVLRRFLFRDVIR